ncbi:MAG: VOC family protein [Candidatus Acidiferrales bacterium]|jgi:methylmalonyl-CoA/ethylmalonyl-CoA epimerase
MPQVPLQLGVIGQIAVPVTNLERAVPFYRDTLGLKFLFQVPNLAFFDCAGVRLMLDVPQDGSGERGSSVIYFKVDDINNAHETLVARGAVFVEKPHLIAKMPDHDLWMAFFRDPDDNLLALMSEVRPASSD